MVNHIENSHSLNEASAKLQLSSQLEYASYDIDSVFREIFRGWKSLIVGCLLGLSLAVIGALSLSPKFEAKMTVSSSPSALGSDTGTGGVGSGLASLAGFNLSASAQVTPFQEFILTLHSAQLAQRLSANSTFMKMAFPSSWDSERQQWRKRPGHFDAINSFFGFHNDQRVGVDDIQAVLQHNLKVETEKDSSAVVLSYRSQSPSVSFSILKIVTDEADQIVRKASFARSSEQARFITERLSRITNADHRQVLVTLLSEYERKALLSQSELPFAIKIIDPPFAPLNPISPRPITLLIAGGIAGILASSLIIIARDAKKRAKRLIVHNSLNE